MINTINGSSDLSATHTSREHLELLVQMLLYILGHVGWGIAWYINGLLIPEIHVVRGKTYTFVIEGGQDPSQPAAYHPFYITDDPEGGYEFMTNERKRKV